ncbi:MAG TPA: nitrilase-related carbon-nitrogen hydrolase [Tepidisphaeraceae bacterium]|nr:nitrilase-related carbon-nitrogen hydrolase [Tepidisphaeraceae bacterium]
MNVLALQLDIVWHDPAANIEKVRRLLDRAHIPEGAMLVLPEMFATGFSMDVEQTAGISISNTNEFLGALSRDRKACVVAGVVSRQQNGKPVNEAAVYLPDGKALRYQKIHPFTPGGESAQYDAGKQLLLFDWQGFKVAPFVCYDLRFPEVFRAATHRGAQVLIDIANWPVARQEHWTTLLRARAIENQAYMIGVNRCGKDPSFSYAGGSQIIGPRGGIIADAGPREGIITASLCLDALNEYRRELPFLADLRPEFLGKL